MAASLMAAFLALPLALLAQLFADTLKAMPGCRVARRTQIIPSHRQLIIAISHTAQDIHVPALQPDQLIAGEGPLDGLAQPALILGPNRPGIAGQLGIVSSRAVT